MLRLLCCLLLVVFYTELEANAQPQQSRPRPSRSPRILLIPLDDRPPCLQFPTLIGRIGGVEVVTPPRPMLGRFTEPGNPEMIIEWLQRHEVKGYESAIISIDMLAYGGLVNSRIHRTPLNKALKHLEIVQTIRRVAPRLPIYGFNVIMRLAPTADGRNEAYRAKLARWAEISPDGPKDAKLRKEVAELESEIPAAALSDYKDARRRNFRINQASIEMVRRSVLDYLILSQDDAKPRGVHVGERERLVGEAAQLRISEKVVVQPGADEVAMLLLARALNRRFNYTPRIAAVFSSEATRNKVMPFEDRPLHRTVSFHIAAAGGREVVRDEDADILFYVYASRHEAGAAPSFAEQVERAIKQKRPVIVADIDPVGDVQGADPRFTEHLRKRKLFPRLTGYASWNTAGNTIGTALSHGIVYALSLHRLANDALIAGDLAERVGNAQLKFLLHRLADDYVYHALVRPQAKELAASSKLNPNNLAGENQKRVESFIREQVSAQIGDFRRDFTDPFLAVKFDGQGSVRFEPHGITNFVLSLPWGRTFEAEIDFDVEAEAITSRIP
ncbi:MAG: DUF4127 family protein [Pyrinomonadaceae bacterium]|nr:DUF4127 family protein [Pyrinomonadaceae bacterium]